MINIIEDNFEWKTFDIVGKKTDKIEHYYTHYLIS